jgi:muconolactone D-isomerase
VPADALFMVRTRVVGTESLTDAELTEMLAVEYRRGVELAEAGSIVAFWRVVGRREAVGIWRVESADALHVLLSELPMYRYFDIQVTPLASHPVAEGLPPGPTRVDPPH